MSPTTRRPVRLEAPSARLRRQLLPKHALHKKTKNKKKAWRSVTGVLFEIGLHSACGDCDNTVVDVRAYVLLCGSQPFGASAN